MEKLRFPLGLRECDIEPQEYSLSHILASYRGGQDKTNRVNKTTIIGAEDPQVKSDGYINFWVADRYPMYDSGGYFRRMKNRIRLAFLVLQGKVDVLWYT